MKMKILITIIICFLLPVVIAYNIVIELNVTISDWYFWVYFTEMVVYGFYMFKIRDYLLNIIQKEN